MVDDEKTYETNKSFNNTFFSFHFVLPTLSTIGALNQRLWIIIILRHLGLHLHVRTIHVHCTSIRAYYYLLKSLPWYYCYLASFVATSPIQSDQQITTASHSKIIILNEWFMSYDLRYCSKGPIFTNIYISRISSMTMFASYFKVKFPLQKSIDLLVAKSSTLTS